MEVSQSHISDGDGFQGCELISQGAEAVLSLPPLNSLDLSTPCYRLEAHRRVLTKLALQRLWQTEFLGRQAVLKQRFSKKYRHPTLDTKLTTTRLKQVRWVMLFR